MVADIHDYFRIGTLQWMSFPGVALEKAMETLCQDPYFDIIEIEPIDAAMRPGIRAMLEEASMDCCLGVHPSILSTKANANALDEAQRAEAETLLMRAVDEAVALGAEGIAFLAGKWRLEEREQALEQLEKTTVNVCRYAAERGKKVELEVFDYDVDKAALIGPAPLAAAFARRVQQQVKNFGLIVDLSHIPLTHEGIEEAIGCMREHITHLHIGNAVGAPGCENYGDNHPRFGFPNSANGVREVTAFLNALQTHGLMQRGSRMILSFEVKPYQQEDPERVLAGCKKVLRQAWAALEPIT